MTYDRYLKNSFFGSGLALRDFTEILHGKAGFSENFGNGTDTRVPRNVFLYS